MKRGSKATSAATRFRQLVERARFDLKLALDAADAEGFDATIASPVARARRSLRECLERLDGERKGGA